MHYFDNFSFGAYTYLGLHGTYGLCWLLKDMIFPDPTWNRHITLLSFLGSFAFVLGPYWIAPFLLIRDHVEVTPLRACICITIHTLGVVTMMASDSQKFFVLRAKRGLIADGWFARVRNPNYLGEMMLYGSYAVLAQHWVPWAVLVYVWSLLFTSNMVNKEISFRKKEGWSVYSKRSGLLLPKLFVSEEEAEVSSKQQ